MSDIKKWLSKLLGPYEGGPSPSESDEPVACSDCFNDQGLKLDAFLIGLDSPSPCPNCGKTGGRNWAAIFWALWLTGSSFGEHFIAATMVQHR